MPPRVTGSLLATPNASTAAEFSRLNHRHGERALTTSSTGLALGRLPAPDRVNTTWDRLSRARSSTRSMAWPLRTHDRTPTSFMTSGSSGHSSVRWQQTFAVRGPGWAAFRTRAPLERGTLMRQGSLGGGIVVLRDREHGAQAPIAFFPGPRRQMSRSPALTGPPRPGTLRDPVCSRRPGPGRPPRRPRARGRSPVPQGCR